jgi:hypothetical protein
MPAQLSSTWIESGALTPLFDHELESKDAYYLTRNESRPDTVPVHRLREWVLQQFALDR